MKKDFNDTIIRFIYYIYNYRLLYYLPKGNGKNPKLRELEHGTLIKHGDHILEFLGIDGVYARWKAGDEIIIMGHANQNVGEYGEILNPNDEDHDG